MSKHSCESLEDQLRTDLDNVALRQKLIECYLRAFIESFARFPADLESLAKKHAQHMLWMAQHAPEESFIRRTPVLPAWSPDDHARVGSVWMDHLRERPDDVSILLNAASFFCYSCCPKVESDRQKAEKLLRKAHDLEPKNAEACTDLAWVLEFRMLDASPEEKKQLASEGLQLREQAIAVEPTGQLYAQLKGLALDAFYCGNDVKSHTYATQLLEISRDHDEWSPDLSFHAGNIILGRVALRRGNLEEAKARLLDAGKPLPTAIPWLPRNGPNMTLAKELLEKQQKEIVLQYFDACEEFWPEKATLDEWREIVRGGGIPDFGLLLDY